MPLPDLSAREARILLLFAQHFDLPRGARFNTIARATQRSPHVVTDTLKALVRLGCIASAGSGRGRSRSLTLTPEGMRIVSLLEGSELATQPFRDRSRRAIRPPAAEPESAGTSSRESATDLGAEGGVGLSRPRGATDPRRNPSPGTGRESPGTLPIQPGA